MSIPSKVLNTAGAALTQAEVNANFDRLNYPGAYVPSNEELMQLLQIRPDCWCACLDAGLPAGSDMTALKAWLISEGWATAFAAPAGDRLGMGTTIDEDFG